MGTYKLSISNARFLDIGLVIVDSLDEAKIAVRCLQFHDGKYIDEAIYKNLYYRGDVEVIDEEENVVYSNDLDPDPEEDDKYKIDVPEGKILVLYVGEFKGYTELEFDYEVGEGHEFEDEVRCGKWENIFGYIGESAFCLCNDGVKTVIDYHEIDDGDCKAESFFFYDSDGNLLREGSPENEDIPELDDCY